MDKKNVEIQESALKCDNSNCDWTGPDINFPEYKEWVNRPCPKCGENLLTMDDYERVEILRITMEIVNSMSIEELEAISGHVTCEELKQSDMFKDAEGLEHLNCGSESPISICMDTHNAIKVVKISPVDLDKSE